MSWSKLNLTNNNKTDHISTVPNTSSNNKLHLTLAILACIALPLIIYSNSLDVPFTFDDIAQIVENPDIKDLSNLKTKLIYPIRNSKFEYRNDPSRPLAYFTFTLNYYFGKLDPFGYHLFNVSLHLIATILIFLLTRKFFLYLFQFSEGLLANIAKDKRLKQTHPLSDQRWGILLSLAVALLFAVHPINTEAVTYITHRSDILATIFYLLSLLFYLKSFEKGKSLYLFSLLCCILAFLSKEIAATLPAMILILDYIFLSDFKLEKVVQKKFYHLPFWILLGAYLILRYHYIGIGTGRFDTKLLWSPYTYFITQSLIILKYLKLLLIPLGQCVDHFIEPAETIFESKIILSFTLLIGIPLVICFIFKHCFSFLSRLVLFSILWFFFTLSPTSSFLPINDAMVERRLYLPGLGFSLVIVSLYLLIFRINFQESFNKKRAKILLCFLSIHILSLSFMTWKRNQLYQNPILLWQESVSNYPANDRAYYNLGTLYYLNKEYERARQLYQKAIELNPNYVHAYNNLGALYYENKEYERARQLYQKAIELNPSYVDAYNNLGVLHYENKEYERARQLYQKAIELNPSYADAYNNLGNICFVNKEYERAGQLYQKAIELNPSYADAYNNLGYYASFSRL